MSENKSLRERIKEHYEAVVKSGSLEDYIKFSGSLEKMDGELRDCAQKNVAEEMKTVLEKLKNEETLSEKDLSNIKSWIIGDAEYYMKQDNNCEAWNAELKQVMEKIFVLWNENPGLEQSLKLRGLAREALRTVGDLQFYVKQKESVEKFNAATKEIGELERTVLMSLLEQKISASRL